MHTNILGGDRVRVLRMDVQHFRGIGQLRIEPRGHVALVGPPQVGRSTIVESLRRVLAADSTRAPLLDDLDFHGCDTGRPIEIEVILGDLGDDLEQRFLDHLEAWDPSDQELIDDLAAAQAVEPLPQVLRLCYRARWNEAEERADHRVYLPKHSRPENDRYLDMRRRDREALPFVLIPRRQRALDLSDRASFRRLVEDAEGDDFAKAIEDMSQRHAEAALGFSTSGQVGAALDSVLDPVRSLLDLRSHTGAVRFVPDGGSVAGLLRALSPTLEAGGSPGHLPLTLHGSTVSTLLAVAESFAPANGGQAVVVVDDFGEDLDVSAARHLAARLRATVGQVWLSTRRGATLQAFELREIIRLSTRGPDRSAYQLAPLTSKKDRSLIRHLSTQLLPAVDARCIVIPEGSHDQAALGAVERRLARAGAEERLACVRAITVDTGLAGGGGSSATARLAGLAAQLGFRTVVVLDGDTPQGEVDEALASADVVVRLPDRHAIERVLIEGVPHETVLATLRAVAEAHEVRPRGEWDALSAKDLLKLAVEILKTSGGLHAQYIEELPTGLIPPLAVQLVAAVAEAAAGRRGGLVQMAPLVEDGAQPPSPLSA